MKLSSVMLFLIGVAIAVFAYRRFRSKTPLEAHFAEQKSLVKLGAAKTEATTAAIDPFAWISGFPGTTAGLDPFAGFNFLQSVKDNPRFGVET